MHAFKIIRIKLYNYLSIAAFNIVCQQNMNWFTTSIPKLSRQHIKLVPEKLYQSVAAYSNTASSQCESITQMEQAKDKLQTQAVYHKTNVRENRTWNQEWIIQKKIATLGTQYTGRRQIKTNKKQQGKLKR